MSEKFFVVTEASPLYKEYFEWKQNCHDVNEFVKDFTKIRGIEAHEYYASSDRFYIVPTENDSMKFISQLAAHELDNGLRAFKKNSSIGTAWVAGLKAHKLSVKHKPFALFYVKNSCGRSQSRLFDISGTLYMSFSNESNFEVEDGICEIRGSKFYKAIEDYETKREASE